MQLNLDLLWKMNQDFVTGSHKESVPDKLEFLCRTILKHSTPNINNIHKLVIQELFYHSRPLRINHTSIDAVNFPAEPPELPKGIDWARYFNRF